MDPADDFRGGPARTRVGVNVGGKDAARFHLGLPLLFDAVPPVELGKFDQITGGILS